MAALSGDVMRKTSVDMNDLVDYQGRMVDKDTFAAFVYDKDGNEQLAKSWDEYQELITTGIWLSVKPEPKLEVVKNAK